MGRKKRKTASDDPEEDLAAVHTAESSNDDNKSDEIQANEGDSKNQQSSGYAVTSHSGEIIQEDSYISDGSESGDEDAEGNQIEVVLTGSRMGMMRKGLHHPLVQPKRQWTRAVEEADETGNTLTPEQRRQLEEEELAKLDPAERAARLLQEKQRKLEEAKELARRRESEENAGRDAMLFSKRTAFDIRFDQIEDKPWLLGKGDFSDFFNYGLTEEEWLEYSEQQLIVRQELIDARRQKRKPDPTLVPVTPREPSSLAKDNASGEDEAGNGKGSIEGDMDLDSDEVAMPSMGPERPDGVKTETEQPLKPAEKEEELDIDLPTDIGGAWGAGAAPDSLLAKLIEQQEQQNDPYGGHQSQYQLQNDEAIDERASEPVYRPHQGTSVSHERTSDYGDSGYGNAAPSQNYGHGRNDSSYYGHNHSEPPGGGRGHRHRDQGSDNRQDFPRSQHTYGHEHHDSGYRRGGGRGGRGGDQYGGRGADHYGGRGGRGGRGLVPQWGEREPHGSRKRSWEDDSGRRR